MVNVWVDCLLCCVTMLIRMRIAKMKAAAVLLRKIRMCNRQVHDRWVSLALFLFKDLFANKIFFLIIKRLNHQNVLVHVCWTYCQDYVQVSSFQTQQTAKMVKFVVTQREPRQHHVQNQHKDHKWQHDDLSYQPRHKHQTTGKIVPEHVSCRSSRSHVSVSRNRIANH